MGMSCCSGCSSYSAAEQQFGSAIARRDLQRYRRKGPDASTRVMLEIVASDVHAGASLLDIGGGFGVMSFELLSRGVREATSSMPRRRIWTPPARRPSGAASPHSCGVWAATS